MRWQNGETPLWPGGLYGDSVHTPEGFLCGFVGVFVTVPTQKNQKWNDLLKKTTLKTKLSLSICMPGPLCLWGPAVQSGSLVTALLSGQTNTPKELPDGWRALSSLHSSFRIPIFLSIPLLWFPFYTFLSLCILSLPLCPSLPISSPEPWWINASLMSWSTGHLAQRHMFRLWSLSNFSKSLQICVFSTCAGGLWHDRVGLLHFTSNHCTDKNTAGIRKMQICWYF